MCKVLHKSPLFKPTKIDRSTKNIFPERSNRKLEWFQAEYDYWFYKEWVSRVETQTVKLVPEVHLVVTL